LTPGISWSLFAQPGDANYRNSIQKTTRPFPSIEGHYLLSALCTTRLLKENRLSGAIIDRSLSGVNPIPEIRQPLAFVVLGATSGHYEGLVPNPRPFHAPGKWGLCK
jgi:hypothetical protein